MHIGIFSKLGADGGSEHRCAEMANGITKYTGHKVTLLCEDKLNERIRQKLDPNVDVALQVFGETGTNRDLIYEVDSLLIINSDSYSFSKVDYWEGRAWNKGKNRYHHQFKMDLSKIKQMVFLYNFVVSPSKHLADLSKKCRDVRIICANKRFFNEITTHDRHEGMRHLPRITLDSAIDPHSIMQTKTQSDKIRIGKHSLPHKYKFNEEHKELIEMVNSEFGQYVHWDFMGVPGDRVKELENIPNVTIREKFSMSVKEYLSGIDIFLFFINWGRVEPWSRAVAEAMLSAIPVIATDKAGNQDQIINGNNGFLCSKTKGMYDAIKYLIENPGVRRQMGLNNYIYAQRFLTPKIIEQYTSFIQSNIRIRT